MNTENLKSIGTALLTLVGTILIGKNIMGHTIDANIFQDLAGAATLIGGVVLGILNHSATIEKIQSSLHSAIVIAAGVAVSWGLLSAQMAVAIGGLATAAIPVILSYTSKVKVKQAQAGTIIPDATTGKMLKAA